MTSVVIWNFTVFMAQRKNTKVIEDQAINLIVSYLIKKEGISIKNIQIIKRGVDIIAGRKWIEAKGCLKRETNIRVVSQALEYVKKNGKLNDFYIYYVYDIASGKPKLMIFDYATFEKRKVKEIKYIIQPFKIHRDTGNPKVINLN